MDPDDLDGKRLEEDWEHALDAAAANEHLRDERKWLSGFRSSLHRLFPSRRADRPN